MCVLEREWEFGLQLHKLCSGSKGLKLYDDFVIAICEYMCMQMFVDVWHYIIQILVWNLSALNISIYALLPFGPEMFLNSRWIKHSDLQIFVFKTAFIVEIDAVDLPLSAQYPGPQTPWRRRRETLAQLVWCRRNVLLENHSLRVAPKTRNKASDLTSFFSLLTPYL